MVQGEHWQLPNLYTHFMQFLNQSHAGHREACAWFLEITLMRICMHVRVCHEAINNYWRDFDFV